MTRSWVVLIALAPLVFSSACADSPTRAPLWRVDSEHNTVFLLASVHLLRPSDQPLPAAIFVAYDESETLVMELDMDDLSPVDAAGLAAELGTIAEGGTLAALLGPSDFARAEAMAQSASLPLEALAHTELWLAAITIEQWMLSRTGFDPALGVEHQLMLRAVHDGKEILGLETLRQQLSILDRLPLDVQRDLLLRTIEESLEAKGVMDELINAWRVGDTDTLEITLLNDMQESPILYRELVVARNQHWVDQIEMLLKEPDDYLVVVGALHLVGPDSVLALLGSRGFKARQMEAPAAN